MLTSTHPTSAPRWALHTFSARGDRLNAISWRSSSFCVAVGDSGLVVVRRRGALGSRPRPPDTSSPHALR